MAERHGPTTPAAESGTRTETHFYGPGQMQPLKGPVAAILAADPKTAAVLISDAIARTSEKVESGTGNGPESGPTTDVGAGEGASASKSGSSPVVTPGSVDARNIFNDPDELAAHRAAIGKAVVQAAPRRPRGAAAPAAETPVRTGGTMLQMPSASGSSIVIEKVPTGSWVTLRRVAIGTVLVLGGVMVLAGGLNYAFGKNNSQSTPAQKAAGSSTGGETGGEGEESGRGMGNTEGRPNDF